MAAPIIEKIFQVIAAANFGELVGDVQQVDPGHQIILMLELGFRRKKLMISPR